MPMELQVSKPKEFIPTVIPNNFYKAKVSGIKQAEGAQGPFLVIEMEVIEGDHAGKKLDAMCSLALNPKTKLYRFITALKIPVPEVSNNFNTDDMIGKVARILTKQKDRKDIEGKVMKQSYVDDLEPLE